MNTPRHKPSVSEQAEDMIGPIQAVHDHGLVLITLLEGCAKDIRNPEILISLKRVAWDIVAEAEDLERRCKQLSDELEAATIARRFAAGDVQ